MTEPICGHTDPALPGEQCLGTPGHKGRHKMRPIEPPSMAESVITPDGVEVAVVEVVGKEGETLPAALAGWRPEADDFVSLKGKAYLPARRRIQWMRGLPDPHPDWTIDTEVVEHVVGKLVKPGPVGVGKVEGGYAVIRANVFDADGRLIATGLKSEYSENFTDYLEKAETGAIARALAVAGYGTESAIDLDEGVDAGRIADAPVEVPARSVRLGSSAVAGVGRGGKTDGASVAQIRRVADLSRELDLSAERLAAMIESLLGHGPVLTGDEAANDRSLAMFLSGESGDNVGAIINTLEAALSAGK